RAGPRSTQNWKSARRRVSARARAALERLVADLTRADPDRDLDRLDPELAVADPACPRRIDDRVGHLLGLAILHEDLDLDLRHKIHLVLAAPVHLGVPALATVTAGLGDSDPRHVEIV